MQRYRLVRSPIKKTPLGYERTWKHEFTVEEFKLTDAWSVPPYVPQPQVCEEHKPYCFLIKIPYPAGYSQGLWIQLNPFKIKEEMPGYGHKLVEIKGGAMHRPFGLCHAEAKLAIYVKPKGEKTFKKAAEYNLPHKDNDWYNYKLTPNISLEEYESFMIGILQAAITYLPWGAIERHDAGQNGGPIVVTCKYYTTEPPKTADVEIMVIDEVTSEPIRGAYVALRKDEVAYYDGYTDSRGRIFFDDVIEDSYELYVVASGYREYIGSITVKPPKVSKTVKLKKAPSPPPPPWARYVKYGLIGGGIGAGAGFAYALFTGKPIKKNMMYGATAGALAGAALSYVFGWE